MSLTPPPAEASTDNQLLVPLLLSATVYHTILSMVRVTTSYRAVELGLSEIWLGVIAGAFALLPIFLAVLVGRFVDRGHDALTTWIGSWIIVAACLGFWALPTTAVTLLVFTSLMGIGHLLLMVSHQVLCVRCGTNDSREAVFGNYMVANAIGQGLGPMLVAWLGGAARIPPTGRLFALAFGLSIVALAVAYLIRPAVQDRSEAAQAGITPLSALLHTPGVPTLMFASVITVTAQDLIVIYLPLLGTERGIDVAHIGMLLMARSAASVVARIFYAPIIRLVGRVPLTVMTLMASAVAFLLLATPISLWVLYLCVSVIGIGIGIAATLSISNMIDIVPSTSRGIVLSVRITGNRIGQVSFPFLAGIVAAASGVGGIFVLLALGLAASSASVHLVRGGKKH